MAIDKTAGPSGFGFASTADEVTEGIDLSGTTWLVTGCNSGLGLETTRVLTRRGGHVIGAARTEDKARAAFTELGIDGTPLACELSDIGSVRAAVARVKAIGRPLDGIVANAGIMALPELRQQHGYELQWFTNHVGHAALVTPLAGSLTDDGRVVILSSMAHRMAEERGLELDNLSGERDYHPWRMYGRSKLANLLYARALARRLKPGQTANAVHPGVIETNLARHVPNPEQMFAGMRDRLKTVPQGAATQCYVATNPRVRGVTGRYFIDSNEATPIAAATDDALAEALWARTEQILAAL